jgi:DNA-directed RNA polymerase subunit beta
VPEDYLLGRTLATQRRRQAETGEIIAKANDEITEDAAEEAARGRRRRIQTIYTNDLDQGAVHLADAAHRRDRRPVAARVAIYRMMRPGEPPTEDAVEALFHGLFFSEGRYDLSASAA